MSQIILAVDDEPLVLEILGEMLEDLGCEVIRSDCPKKALQILEEDERIHALVTDVNMAGIDGYELVDRARRLRPGLQAIVISGRPQSRSDVPHIGKPFSQQTLQAMMAKTMDLCAENYGRRGDSHRIQTGLDSADLGGGHDRR